MAIFNSYVSLPEGNVKMQRNWLHGFRSLLSAGGGLRGARCLSAFATVLGSYLSTFLDSFLREDMCYNLNSKLERQ